MGMITPMDFEYRLEDKPYYIPKCKTENLLFETAGIWD